jgi:threonine aldolase
MQAAMAAAPLGDDVFGDDPSVNALQDKIAAMLGFEAALFVPTGTQSNLCAILSHCQRGDEYIVGQMQHCYRWEGGGAAVNGATSRWSIGRRQPGWPCRAAIAGRPHLRAAGCWRWNTLGGKLLPFAYLSRPQSSLNASWPCLVAHGFSAAARRQPRPAISAARPAHRPCSTACRCASARDWARPWVRPCAVHTS